MTYLYGDSTSSNLEVNYIEFLRDSVEFCVQILLSDQRVVQGRAQTRSLEHATAAEAERLQKLGALVSKAFEGAPLGAPDSATAHCAAAILRSASDLVRVEAVRLRDALDAEISKRDAQSAQERDGCVKALEALLVKHDLPDTVVDMHFAIAGGARYVCRARMKTGFGLEAMLELEIPQNHLFDRVVRVDRLAERLDVQAPEKGGWLHKEVKRRTQHLEKHSISEFSIGPGGGTLKLRTGVDGSGPGFDVTFSREAPRVRLARFDQQEGAAEQPFEVEDEDAKKLLAVYGKLAKAAADLSGHRRRLADARIDGEAVRSHAKPAVLVERLIATMAPVVQEIASRSHSPGELVLRRLIDGNRREEIFLSKQELKQKLEPLVEGNRALFDALWATGANAPVNVSTRPSQARVDIPTPTATPTSAAAAAKAAESAPSAAHSHAQTGRYGRGSTPSMGTPPLNASMPGSAVTRPTSAPAAESSVSADMRRTLIGTTVTSVSGGTPAPVPTTATGQGSAPVPTAIKGQVSAPVAVIPEKTPVDAVSKTPLVVESSIRKEAAGTIEAAVSKETNSGRHNSGRH